MTLKKFSTRNLFTLAFFSLVLISCGVKQQKTVVNNQKSAIKSSHEPNLDTIKRMDEHIDFIEDQIQAIEEELKKVVASDPILQKKVENVCTIKAFNLLRRLQL